MGNFADMDNQLKNWVSCWHIRMAKLIMNSDSEKAWPHIPAIRVHEYQWELSINRHDRAEEAIYCTRLW